MFVSSTSGNSDRAKFTALHSTSMPAGQHVDAVPVKGMIIKHAERCGSAISKIRMV